LNTARKYIAATTTSAGPNGNVNAQSGWVPVWKAGGAGFGLGSVVFSNGQYYKAGGGNASILSSAQPSPLSDRLYSWLPLWKSNLAVLEGSYVIDSSSNIFYREVEIAAQSNTIQPVPTNTVGTGWLPVWRDTSYGRGQYVFHAPTGIKYIATTEGTTGAPTGINRTGSGWMTLWREGDPFEITDYVFYNGVSYCAWNDVAPLDLTEPEPMVNVVEGWVPQWSNNLMFEPGNFVVDNDGLYTALRMISPVRGLNTIRPVNDSNAVNWAKWWEAGTYPKGLATAAPDGRVYIAVTDVDETVIPVTNNKNPTGWLPRFATADTPIYDVGDYVVHNNRTFKRNSSILTVTIPTINVGTLQAFIPLWTSGDPYYVSNYVLHSDKLYWKA
jgi:hypothetical protein